MKNASEQISKALGLTEEQLESVLEGTETATPNRTPMKLKVEVEAGIGAGAHVCLGWADTQGYRMVGVGGKAAAAFSAGGKIFAGKHRSGNSVKIILGISNFNFEYILPLGTPLEAG